jgi:hypothetical protein
MRKLFLLLLLFPAALFSQSDSDTLTLRDTAWRVGGSFGLNFAQASFTNWAAGGVNSLSGQTMIDGFARYKKDSVTWDNSILISYGLLQQDGFTGLRKTDDRLDISSKAGVYAFKKVWYYSALLGFKTQFSPGYNYLGDTARTLISDFMSPGYLLMAIGLDYKPNDQFSLLMAPVTGRTTFVLNQSLADQGAFGVKAAETDTAGRVLVPGEHVRHEFGGYIRAQYKADIMTNVTLSARCELFSNYLDRPQNIDVNAELGLTMKVNRFISANFKAQMIYDNDVNIKVDDNHDGVIDSEGPRLQLSQVLGVGLLVKF